MQRLFGLLLLVGSAGCASTKPPETPSEPFLVVLGIAQDGGAPQTGDHGHPGWEDADQRRRVVCLGLVDPRSGERWLFEATPDFPEQLRALDRVAPSALRPGLNGIFLTHAHIGHYTGLMFLGHESLGTKQIRVHTMPRMAAYLESNGPWSQLVKYENIQLQRLAAGTPLVLNERLRVTPILVPHRQEFSEVVGFRIDGPQRSAFFLPDIDSWEEWEQTGTRVEDVIASVDVAFLDATFFANGEILGRDMSGFPHPFLTHSMERFRVLPAVERAKVHFLHLNHTNPALWPETKERRSVEEAGFNVAEEGSLFPL